MGRRVLRRHIWGYSVCLCPLKSSPGLYGLLEPRHEKILFCLLPRYHKLSSFYNQYQYQDFQTSVTEHTGLCRSRRRALFHGYDEKFGPWTSYPDRCRFETLQKFTSINLMSKSFSGVHMLRKTCLVSQ